MKNLFGVLVSGSAPIVTALGLLVTSRFALAGWPVRGGPVTTAPGTQLHPAAASDGAGGAIVAWADLRDAKVGIFAAHVLASGERDPLWPVGGRPLLGDPAALAGSAGGQRSPVIAADGQGGAFVAWVDDRSGLTGEDIFAQHLLANGTLDPAWPVNGQPLCAAPGNQNAPVMTADGFGGAIVAWVDARSGANNLDIFAQHVPATGVVDTRWLVSGSPICTAPGVQGALAITTPEAPGGSGAIIAWQDARSGIDSDIYVQRIQNSGVLAPGWPVNGRAVCTFAGDQVEPTVASDDAFGAIVAWTDGRAVGSKYIFAQHVMSNSTIDSAWPVNGRGVSLGSPSEGHPLAVSDAEGGAIITWQMTDDHVHVLAQHVEFNSAGDGRWPPAGRELGAFAQSQVSASIVLDGAGGAIVAWGGVFFASADSEGVVAQDVSASGALAYPDFGLLLAGPAARFSGLALAATSGGGAIATWSIASTASALPDVFAQRIPLNGTLDVPAGTASGPRFSGSGPNPARTSLALHFALPRDAHVRLAIYDASGRRVRELMTGTEPAGEHAIRWDLRDERGQPVNAGVYFARLEVEGRTLSQRFTRLN